jgi:LmbE family N-acetylglucosaminyl deacetylase
MFIRYTIYERRYYTMKKRILFSFAHPDDESFTVGGLLASLASREDIETIVYTTTLGDAGKCGNPPICEQEALPDIRKKELKLAAEILGINYLVYDTFPDGKLNTLAPAVLANRVEEVIREYQPQIVITFPPHGISGHPDHIEIQKATMQAIKQNEHLSVEALYYVTVTKSCDCNMQVAYANTLDEIDVTIQYGLKEAEIVKRALKAHRTQHNSVERVFPSIHQDNFEKFGNIEHFMLAWSKTDYHAQQNKII